jgi:hypothetical protein
MTQAFNLSQFANKVNTSGQADLTTAVTGILPIANGGTGASTLTANNVMLGNGTGAIQFVAPSTSGNSLVSNGTSWISSTPAAPPKLSTASGSAPSYSARAWVLFNGTGTVSITGSANVSSITDDGTGLYTLNFSTAMPDANYSVTGSGYRIQDGQYTCLSSSTLTASSAQVSSWGSFSATTNRDAAQISVAIFR